MNMKLLAVVTPPFIHPVFPTRNTFWEKKCTLGEFTLLNMKIMVASMLGNTGR